MLDSLGKNIAKKFAKDFLSSDEKRRNFSEKIADALIESLKNMSEEDIKKIYEALVNTTEENRDKIVDWINKALKIVTEKM